MRILLVNAHGVDPTSGGAERYVGDLLAGLRDRGHEVEVLSAFPPRGGSAMGTHVLHQVDWRDNRRRRFHNHVGDVVSAPWPRVAAVLDDVKPDLVHTNNLPGIGTGVWEVARRAGIPVVHTLHDHYLLCPRTTLLRRDGSPCTPHPLLCGARTRRLARWRQGVSAVIGPSEYILRAHAAVFAATPKHIVRPPLKPFGSPKTNPSMPPRTLGYMGALAAGKGVPLLLEAAESLQQEGLELRLAGDGPLRSAVEASQHVRYEGWLPRHELDAFVGSCDIGLVPSLNEASGPTYVVCEWLAAGRPVLASRGGALTEIRAGAVVTFDVSPEGLVEAVRRLRTEQEWQRVLGTVPEVTDDDDVERWLDQHEATYESAFGRVPAPRTS